MKLLLAAVIVALVVFMAGDVVTHQAEAWCAYGDTNCNSVFYNTPTQTWYFCNDEFCHTEYTCYQGWYAWANHFYQSWGGLDWNWFWWWWNACGTHGF